MDDITRDVLEGIGPDGIDVRLYTRGADQLPSVTTVLKTRDDDKSHLYDWQDRNDGEDDAANHEHLFWYSRQVGTLGHWFALRQLDGDLDWSKDEARSLWALNNVQHINDDSIYRFHDTRLGHDVTLDGGKHEEIHDAGPREVLYSICRGDKNKGGGTVSTWGEFYDEYPPYRTHEFYSDALESRAEADITFFRDGQARLWSKLRIDDEDVITVEEFLFNETDGYAGQVDLVYQDGEHTVVADLKSSSGCYDKHQLQGAAYAKAIEQADDVPVESVDRLEVHRAHPRSGEMAVHTHADAPGQQPVHTTQYWYDSYEDCWQQFERLASSFSYVNPNIDVDV
jgi:hypothetical protein